MWDETVPDAFQVVTGANLTESNRTGMMPGPAADSRNDANGKYFYSFNCYFFIFQFTRFMFYWITNRRVAGVFFSFLALCPTP